MRLTSAVLLAAAIAVFPDQACGSDACCARHGPAGIQVLDPTVSRPDDWDDEDDGVWVSAVTLSPGGPASKPPTALCAFAVDVTPPATARAAAAGGPRACAGAVMLLVCLRSAQRATDL